MIFGHLILSNEKVYLQVHLYEPLDNEYIRPHIFDTVVEESGHIGLLARKLKEWSEKYFPIEGLEEFQSHMDVVPDPREHVRLLEESVRVQSERYAAERKKNLELTRAVEEERSWAGHYRERADQSRVETMLLDRIQHIAEHELRCPHIRRAILVSQGWNANHLH